MHLSNIIHNTDGEYVGGEYTDGETNMIDILQKQLDENTKQLDAIQEALKNHKHNNGNEKSEKSEK